MPYAPKSSAFMIVAGSFHATRTTGTVSVCEIACSIGHRFAMSVRPCCMSTTRASNPWRAMTSAVKPLEIDSQPILTQRPSRHSCLLLFGRILAPPGAERNTVSGVQSRPEVAMARPVAYPAPIEPLVRFVEDTSPEHIVARTHDRLAGGTPVKD